MLTERRRLHSADANARDSTLDGVAFIRAEGPSSHGSDCVAVDPVAKSAGTSVKRRITTDMLTIFLCMYG